MKWLRAQKASKPPTSSLKSRFRRRSARDLFQALPASAKKSRRREENLPSDGGFFRALKGRSVRGSDAREQLVAELPAAQGAGPGREGCQVACHAPRGDLLLDGGDHQIGRFIPADVPEHHFR